MDADWIIKHLGLEPHPGEGGYFRETYRSPLIFHREAHGNDYGGDRSICTAIYYLLTKESFSAMHRLRTDEIFHFYLGDPVELLRLAPDGSGEVVGLGSDLVAGISLRFWSRPDTGRAFRWRRAGKLPCSARL